MSDETEVPKINYDAVKDEPQIDLEAEMKKQKLEEQKRTAEAIRRGVDMKALKKQYKGKIQTVDFTEEKKK